MQRVAMAVRTTDGAKQAFAIRDAPIVEIASRRRCERAYIGDDRVELRVGELQLRRAIRTFVLSRAILGRKKRRGYADVFNEGIGDLLFEIGLIGLQSEAAKRSFVVVISRVNNAGNPPSLSYFFSINGLTGCTGCPVINISPDTLPKPISLI